MNTNRRILCREIRIPIAPGFVDVKYDIHIYEGERLLKVHKEIPAPLLHQAIYAAQVDWSDILPEPLPVTIEYSQTAVPQL